MDLKSLYTAYPRLYHMASHDALPNILKHGLLSTRALLELFEVPQDVKVRLLTKMRRESFILTHPVHGKAVVRDQKPIGSDLRLASALGTSATSAEWHSLLNSKVFFWVNPDRLSGLRNASAYRGDPQLILTLDTRLVVEAFAERVWLCPMNSGACRPMAHPRTPNIFQRIHDFDFIASKRKRGRNAVVEFAIDDSLPDVSRFMINHEILGL